MNPSQVLIATFLICVLDPAAYGGVPQIKVAQELQHEKVINLAFCETAPLLATTSRDGTVILWDLEKSKEVQSYNVGGSASAVDFSSDGRWLAVGGTDALLVWSVENWKLEPGAVAPPMYLKHKAYSLEVLRFSADSTRLFAGGHSDPVHGWSTENWEPIKLRLGHVPPKSLVGQPGKAHHAVIEFIDLAPDGRTMISGGRAPFIRFSLRDKKGRWKNVVNIKEPPTRFSFSRDARFSKDGRVVAVAAVGGRLLLFDAKRLKKVHDIKVASNGSVNTVEFAGDGKHVITAARRLKVWNVASAKLIKEFDLPSYGARLRRSPDNKKLALCLPEENKVRIYSLGN